MSAAAAPRRIAFLGNYPPQMCGVATFTRDLFQAVAQAVPDDDCFVCAVSRKTKGFRHPEEVRFCLEETDFEAYGSAADYLNFHDTDILCVQHEFGIYGGPSGSYLLALLKEVRMPVVTTLHTVLETPDRTQLGVMRELARRSDRIVVMGRKAIEILRGVYGVPEAKVDLVPHGIPDLPFTESAVYKERFSVAGREVMLTFGLLGPGKGIEHAIRALPAIVAKHPEVIYVILGATHPNLLEHEGERYRLDLTRLCEAMGVEKHVIFHNRFVTVKELDEFIGAADIYLTPYPNREQITSGTLARAFGAGKAVVSTPYWHAEELLADERGVLVPFRDPAAISEAVCGLLEDPSRMQRIRAAAYAEGRCMTWPAVATLYLDSFARARAERRQSSRAAFAGWTLENRPHPLPPRRLKHLLRMTDTTGILQHAVFNVPNFQEGYSVDDNARAFILVALLAGREPTPEVPDLERLAAVYLSFLAAALNPENERFRNFMTYDRRWTEEAGSEDSHGRSLWATGLGAARAPNEGFRALSARLFERALPAVGKFTSPRAWAFAVLGIHEHCTDRPEDPLMHELLVVFGRRMMELWHAHADESWPWFELSLTYENARLCQALILAGEHLLDDELLRTGLRSLRWLASVQTTQSGCFRPIGSNGFYARGGPRADYDQQPVEAQAMVAACNVAFRATRDVGWRVESKRAFEWFLGRNDLRLPLCDLQSGACADGLHRERINENQGAESTLAYQLSLFEMHGIELETIVSPDNPPALVTL